MSGEYIANERHKYDMELLTASPTLPEKQVASYCGCRSQLYFAKDFKKHTGMSPIRYREKYSRQSPSPDRLPFPRKKQNQ